MSDLDRTFERPDRRVVVTALGINQILAWGSTLYLLGVLGHPIALDTDWSYEAIALGLPCRVNSGRAVEEPRNLGAGWMGYNFSADCSAFAAPIAVVTCRFSSGGGSTAFIPSDWIHSSRHQPLV